MMILFLLALLSDWTKPVEVRHELRPVVAYRARMSGDYLVIQATLEPGWHTFSMDNKERAKEKLGGHPSLGVDAPTEIKVTQGLQPVAPWYQTPPKDFSKPEMQWFTWGYDGQALFVTKVRPAGSGLARIAIRGQACTDTTCKQVDVALSLPVRAGKSPSDVDLKSLVQVRIDRPPSKR